MTAAKNQKIITSIIESIRRPSANALFSAVSPSNTPSFWYDFEGLTPGELRTLTEHIRPQLDALKFEAVVALAYDGILFGTIVAGDKPINFLRTDGRLWGPPLKGKKVLLADGIITTGNSFRKARELLEKREVEVVGFASIVERSGFEHGDFKGKLVSAVVENA